MVVCIGLGKLKIRSLNKFWKIHLFYMRDQTLSGLIFIGKTRNLTCPPSTENIHLTIHLALLLFGSFSNFTLANARRFIFKKNATLRERKNVFSF